MAFKRLAAAVGFFLFESIAFAQAIAPLAPSVPGLDAPAVSTSSPFGDAAQSGPARDATFTGQDQGRAVSGGSFNLEPGNNADTDALNRDNGMVQRDSSRVPNGFARFISESLGRFLPVFGRSLFERAPSTFSPVEAAAVTPDYVIGVGDEIVVRVWGQAEFVLHLTVQRDGTVALPRAGEVRVAGLQYRDLNDRIKGALGRVFRNFELTVSLGRLTPITVYVVGEAERPGRFNLSPQSTLINAIFAVGGPSPQGSMRSVKVRRGNEVVADLDVYRFIASGDRSADIRLLAGDMIVFESLGPQIAVAGSVSRPAIYELKSPAASVGDVLELAGGITNTATDAFASLERIEARKTRTVAQLSLAGDDLDVLLRDGDLLQVFPISPRFENAITVRGNVAMPLRHPWHEGIRVSDIIRSKKDLIVPSYWKTQNTLPFSETKSGEEIKRDIKRNLPEVNWSYAVVERIGPDLRPKLIPFNLQKAIVDKDPAHDLELVPGDSITVFSKSDIAVPQKERTVYVTLSGEFNIPGVYQLMPGQTLRHAIELAGGVTDNAYILGTSLQRESIREEQQRRIDEIMARIEADLRAANAEIAAKAVSSEGQNFLQSQIAFQEKALNAFRGTAVNGRLYLGLPRRTDLTVADLPDLPVEDGDRIHLPSMQNVVNVFGAVGFQNTQLYESGRSVGSYVETAGGVTRRAEPEDTMVLSVDGAAHKRDRAWWAPWTWGRDVAVMPGDSIFVPEKVDAIPLVAHLKDWTQVLYQMGLGAAAIKTLRD